jgi:two-component system, response regulator PdtaR
MGNLRVAVWHGDRTVVESVIDVVETLGFAISSRGTEGQSLVQHVVTDKSVGLVICGLTLGEADAVSCLVEIAASRPVPAIVVTKDSSLVSIKKVLADHVMAYLTQPPRKAELAAAIHLVIWRFRQFLDLQEEVQGLKSTLAARKQIERAKAVIMRRSNVGEGEAHERLRRLAMDSRIKLVDAAEKILQVEASHRS